MTKKDYELIAEAVLNAASYAERKHNNGYIDKKALEATNDGIYYVVRELAESLASENPKFDHDKFMEACGIPTMK